MEDTSIKFLSGLLFYCFGTNRGKTGQRTKERIHSVLYVIQDHEKYLGCLRFEK